MSPQHRDADVDPGQTADPGLTSDLKEALQGRRIWGDDFSPEAIERWFEQEREGYAGLGAAEHGTANNYGYQELNIRHFFRKLPVGALGSALGLGSAFGGEFLPIIDRLNALTILEPSTALQSERLGNLRPTYVEPRADGRMPFGQNTFDLSVCFGTLHHIPNVTLVVGELARVTRPGGYVLIREPIRSMGDWRKARPGLTMNERGIPLPLLLNACSSAGLVVRHKKLCMFPLTGRLASLGLGFNSKAGVRLDAGLAALTARNDRYHASRSWHKVHPTSVALVLQVR